MYRERIMANIVYRIVAIIASYFFWKSMSNNGMLKQR